MLKEILLPVLSLGGMSLLFGAGLAFASQKFAVETDSRKEKIREILPGANCGACGYPGCDGFAAAVVEGLAPVTSCPVGGNNVAQQIGSIMGLEVEETQRKVARVLCAGDCDNAVEKYRYQGIEDCVAASMLADGPKECSYGCLGLGTCVRACPFEAIYINDKGIAVVDRDKCTACEKCVAACPKNIIEMIPDSSRVQVACISEDKARDVRNACKVGCIACGICEKVCQFDAIKVENNIARIDYDKCVNCMACAEKCPTKAIYADFDSRKVALILEDTCTGCTACKRACKFDAIEGNVKEVHTVIEDKCTGCEECVKKCRFDAIIMK
jgi:electron transport complex protein RnfB